MATNEAQNRTDVASACRLPLCITCSCCCPFHHIHRDEATGKITIRCGNEARWSTDVPNP